ncbi:MAG: polyhydroxyalkanoate synthesis regulator DNA-binding domain-containing protein [Thermoguttaceae bacterium]|jgi:polyhydroxyalkanoate synthesis repressor PhaR
MDEQTPPPRQQIELRKYPNRRYYDGSRSRHATLEEIYGMIRAGHDVHVTDSKTGEDITAKVLAQIILEHDPPKLTIFPVDLLHQVIRANEPLVRDFVDKYFNQALRAFLESQRQFDRYLRQTLGLQASLPLGGDWARMVMGPFAPTLFPPPQPASGKTGDSASGDMASGASSNPIDNGKDLRRVLEELKGQIAALERRLDEKAS